MSSLLRDIDAILDRGSKQTSYKFAILRAMAEWVIEHPLETSHRIPVSWMAYRILPWYVHDGQFEIPHNQKANEPHVVKHASEIAASAGGAKAFQSAWLNKRLPLSRALLQIRHRLVEQPLDKLRNLDGRQLEFYELHGLRDDTKKPAPVRREWTDLHEFLTDDDCYVVLDEDVTTELSPLRFMIRDVTIQRWATWSEELSKVRDIRPYILTSLQDPEPTRLSTKPAADAFRRMQLDQDCVLSGDSIQSLDVDHFLPWSLYPSHEPDNLVPSERKVNQKAKRDYIPQLTNSLEYRLRTFFDSAQRADMSWLGRGFSVNQAVNEIARLADNLAEITGRPRFVPAN